MKLFKKLLPLSGIACVVATATPLAVSCSNNATSGCTIDRIDAIKNGYKRETKYLPSDYLTLDEVATKYLTDIKENPQIFYDDMIESDISDSSSVPLSHKLDTISIKLTNVNVEERRISFETRHKTVIERARRDRITNKTESDIVIKYSNMKVHFSNWGNTYMDFDYTFNNPYPGFVGLRDDDQWSLDYESVTVRESNGEKRTAVEKNTYNSKSSYAALDYVYYGIDDSINRFDVKLSYLKNIRINYEEE